MKHLIKMFVWLFAFVLLWLWWSFTYVESSPFSDPVKFLDNAYNKANKEGKEIQNTDLNQVNSKSDACADLAKDSRFTFTRTLCYIKNNIKNYLDYVLYIWLTAALILIIRNGFKLVTAQDGSKQMTTFKKNMLYIAIWVILLIWFYYIIEIFVSVVNLIGEASE